MSSAKAELVAVFTPDTVLTLITCTAIAALWAGFRPDMVRDADNRRLPPSVTARLMFVILFLVIYLAMTATFHFSGIVVKKLSYLFGPFRTFLEKFENDAPILGLLGLFGLYSIAPFRELERTLLAWMHSTRHLRGDMRALTYHLQECDFVPTNEERRRNIEILQTLDVYITDTDSQAINLSSVTSWRKTASLLRRLREWNAELPSILGQDEARALDELEKAHSRKTRLAMDIIRMLDRVREGGGTATTLSGVMDSLASVSHGNRQELARVEEQVKAKIESGIAPASEGPLRLSSGALLEYLKKIEGYFLVEYRLMLEQAAQLASRSILRAGNHAAQRLEELRTAGFQGLGTIQTMSVHRIIWFLVSVATGGFLIYYTTWYPEVLRRLQERGVREPDLSLQGRITLVGIAAFSSCIALASLIGALFGSNSGHARAKETPWATYLAAGLIAMIGYFLLQMAREVVMLSLNATMLPTLNVATDSFGRLRALAPWSALPFMIAVGICWLARQPQWRVPIRTPFRERRIERIVDGIILGALMLPAYTIAMALIELFGLPKSAILRPGFDPVVVIILSVYGFFVGALVVRDVRSAAHAQIVGVATAKGESASEVASNAALAASPP